MRNLLPLVLFALPAAPQSAIMPAGSQVIIRTIDPVDSQHADLDRDYAATLAEPLKSDEAEIAPLNADAVLRIVEAKKAGKLAGRASLSLRLVAIRIAGQLITVETGDSFLQSASQGRKTAKRAAGGAAIGALIGAVAGGGAGAAAGAAAGGALGGGSAALSGRKVKVPPETRLVFTLTQPLVTGQ